MLVNQPWPTLCIRLGGLVLQVIQPSLVVLAAGIFSFPSSFFIFYFLKFKAFNHRRLLSSCFLTFCWILTLWLFIDFKKREN